MKIQWAKFMQAKKEASSSAVPVYVVLHCEC